MKILITAFEPFGADQENASLEVMNRLLAPDSCILIKMIVPVVFGKAAETVNDVITLEKPDAVICLGQAGGRNAISLERKAVNLCRAARPDNAGNCPAGEAVVPGGKEILETTLPVEHMLERLTNAGIPAELSDSAGTYVCNSLMYGVLHFLENTGQQIPAGFVHVPYFREQTNEKPEETPYMELAEMVRGIQLCLECAKEAL